MISPVKRIREHLLITQEELSRLIGVTRFMVCLYETGKNKPSFGVIRKLMAIAKQNKIDIKAEEFFDK